MRTLSADSAEDYSPVAARDCAEEDGDHGEGDHPINIASIEELPAAFDSSPSLAGKHGEVPVQLLYCQNLYLDSLVLYDCFAMRWITALNNHDVLAMNTMTVDDL